MFFINLKLNYSMVVLEIKSYLSKSIYLVDKNALLKTALFNTTVAYRILDGP